MMNMKGGTALTLTIVGPTSRVVGAAAAGPLAPLAAQVNVKVVGRVVGKVQLEAAAVA